MSQGAESGGFEVLKHDEESVKKLLEGAYGTGTFGRHHGPNCGAIFGETSGRAMDDRHTRNRVIDDGSYET